MGITPRENCAPWRHPATCPEIGGDSWGGTRARKKMRQVLSFPQPRTVLEEGETGRGEVGEKELLRKGEEERESVFQ